MQPVVDLSCSTVFVTCCQVAAKNCLLRVNCVVQADAQAGRSEAVKLLARNNGTVDRKLVKQTVMTSVYGVTFIGARLQIASRLEERGWDNDAEIFKVKLP